MTRRCPYLALCNFYDHRLLSNPMIRHLFVILSILIHSLINKNVVISFRYLIATFLPVGTISLAQSIVTMSETRSNHLL